MKTRFEERLTSMKRKYFEVFADYEAFNEFLKISNLVSYALNLLLLIALLFLVMSPPWVIRVNEVGRAEVIENPKANNEPSEPEILEFSRFFVESFRGLNSYTLSETKHAWNRMSSRYQKIATRDLIDSGFLAKFEGTGLYTRIEIKEETIERETDEYVFVSLVGVRTLLNYNDPDYRESSLFKSELVLKKVRRTRTSPSGLLVENYKEILLNKLEESK